MKRADAVHFRLRGSFARRQRGREKRSRAQGLFFAGPRTRREAQLDRARRLAPGWPDSDPGWVSLGYTYDGAGGPFDRYAEAMARTRLFEAWLMEDGRHRTWVSAGSYRLAEQELRAINDLPPPDAKFNIMETIRRARKG